MNFSIFKKKDNVKEEQSINNENVTEEQSKNNENIFNVKDLYVAHPGLVTVDKKKGIVWFNEKNDKLETIICKRIIYDEVVNVLNDRIYPIFGRVDVYRIVDTYVVKVLEPLELKLEDKSKIIITREEIIEFLYPNIEKEKTSNNIQDIVLKQVGETDDKINKSSLDEEVKEIIKKKLIELAHYYVDSLKNMSNIKNSVNLTKNNLSVIDLRREVMSKLVEIELQLPPEEVDVLYDELDILEHKIKKK